MKTVLQDPKQALRFRRTLLGLTGYAVAYAVVISTFVLGYLNVSAAGLVVALLASLAVNGAFLLLIATGVNRRLFRDPSMTFLQVLVGLLWMLWAVHAAPEVRGFMSLLIIPPFVFGIFRLRTREQLVMVSIISIGYGLIVYRHAQVAPDWVDPIVGGLQWFVVTAILLWFSFISGYVYRLRRRLHAYARDLEQARDKLEVLASKDSLTGIFNRRHIMDVLESERSRAERTDRPFSVVLLDLDRFKELNDTHGHLIGDKVLCTVAATIIAAIRAMDVVGNNNREFGRFGGEEFLLVLPETDAAGALRCAERIRQTVASNTFSTGHDEVRVTISGGVATYRDSETLDQVLHRADQCLYEAKRSGRDRVVSDQNPGESDEPADRQPSRPGGDPRRVGKSD